MAGYLQEDGVKIIHWLCLLTILVWSYPAISYSLSSEEERAKESLRSQLEPGKKKAKKGNADRPDVKISTEPIRPFGPFSWEDDFLSAVLKANTLPGIETVSLEGLNLKEIQTKEQLQRLLADFLNQRFPKSELDTLESVQLVGEYVDASGKRGIYYKGLLNIEVTPVVIAGVPFTLTMTLGNTPGLSIASADKVPSALTSTQDSTDPISVTFPAILGSVQLFSGSPILIQKLPEIEKLLEEKYRKYDPAHHHVMEWRNGGAVHDPTNNNKTWMEIYGPYPFGLKYESHAFGLAMQQKYEEHLANLESDKLRGKVDLKGGL